MARKQPAAQQALLGLLYLAPDGSHGYDLSRKFSNDGLPGAVLRIEVGMLYHNLKQLEKGGLVQSTTEPQETRPTRQVYHLTDDGRQVLMSWLQEPVRHTREIRIEFLLKLYFVRKIKPELAEGLIRDQLAISQQVRAEIEDRMKHVDIADDDDRTFLHETLALRLSQTDASIEWLESLLANRD